MEEPPVVEDPELSTAFMCPIKPLGTFLFIGGKVDNLPMS
jgi:hypothetical protein